MISTNVTTAGGKPRGSAQAAADPPQQRAVHHHEGRGYRAAADPGDMSAQRRMVASMLIEPPIFTQVPVPSTMTEARSVGCAGGRAFAVPGRSLQRQRLH